MTNLDTRTRNFTITVFTSTLNDTALMSAIKELESNNQLKAVSIGPKERTRTEKAHRHLMLLFNNKKSIEQLTKLFPKCHIESLEGTPKEMYAYLTKEGQPLYDTYKDFVRNHEMSINEKLVEIEERLFAGESLFSILKDKALAPIVIKNYTNLSRLEYRFRTEFFSKIKDED